MADGSFQKGLGFRGLGFREHRAALWLCLDARQPSQARQTCAKASLVFRIG